MILAVLVGTIGLRGASTMLSAAENVPLIGGGDTPAPSVSTAPSAPAQQPEKKSPAPKKRTPAKKTPTTKSTNKPVKVKQKGPGTYHHARMSAKSTGKKGRVIRYDVRVEKGMPVNAKQAGTLIHRVLNDKRSWTGDGSVRWVQVSSGKKAEMHAYVASPKTTDRLCAPLLTRGKLSCQQGNRVVLNAQRWATGAPAYGKDVARYRQYLINHEFGHYIGHQHVDCKKKGKRAHVMVQQTKGLGGCTANPWPAPKRK